MKHSYKIKPKRFIALLFVSIFINVALAKNYYVSNSGSSSNDGTSINKAFDSINDAILVAQPGDSIFIMPGKYNGVIAVNDKFGVPEKPICILGYSDNEKDYPIIDGGAKKPSNNADFDWMSIKGSEWIVIGRMKFQNGWTYPIKVENSSYITFNKCMFWGGKRVISATGVLTHHLLVENCYWDQGGEFLWTVKKGPNGKPAWLSMHHLAMGYFNGSLIDFHGTGGSIVIRNNTIINAYNALRWRGVYGYDSNIEIYNNHISQMRDNDFEPEHYTYNLHIYHNFTHNIHRTLSIDHVRGGYIYYYGNVITTDNKPWTIQICHWFGKIYGAADNLNYPLYVFNNSFYGVANAYRVDTGNLIELKHYNNAYYFSRNNGWVVDKWASSDQFDYDISNKNWAPNLIDHNQEKHGKIADIKYVDPEKQNLKLQKDSPGIDAGKIMTFKEFDWTQSYKGKAPDVGAYEGSSLVEGPPFRFRIPPHGNLTYKERPRIVRDDVHNDKLILYFSSELESSSFSENDISLYYNGKLVKIHSLSLVDDNYGIALTTDSHLQKNKLSISFKSFPKSIDGQNATYWASTITIHR